MKMQFLRDARGYPRCEVGPPHEAVGRLLVQDVGRCRQSAEELLARIDAVATGQEAGWSGTGNAFHLSLTPEGAEIECLWDEAMPICRIGLVDLREAVCGWVQLLSERAY